MDFDFKVPSIIPQDLLLIQDLIGAITLPTVATEHVSDSLDSNDDSVASSDDEAESEDEVAADLVPCDEDSGVSVATSDSASHSDSDAGSTSDSEEGNDNETPQQQIPADYIEDEESGMTAVATYFQTRNEIVDADIIVPTISEVDSCDALEKVGEITSIVENTVVVRGLAMDNVKSLSEHALDAESLLVFEDRKVLGYVHETFGPTSQPLYQVKFNQDYPLDANKVWLSREVFHVPQRSQFVFVDQLKKLRGSDASNIHDEEPAEDEIEFSDDEKEATFKAQRKKRRGHSVTSRQSTPTLSRVHVDDIVQEAYHHSNPYDAHGPYDDDYQITGPSRPSPLPYDDPYADVPTSDVRVHATEISDRSGGVPDCNDGSRERYMTSRGHMFNRGARRSRGRNRQLGNTSRREYRPNPIPSRRTFDSDSEQPFLGMPQMAERGTGYAYVGEANSQHPFTQPAANTWVSPETGTISDYPQPFIQPHINPRFASAFGFNMPSESTIPWASQHWNGWAMHGSAGSEGEEDIYRST